MKVGRYEVVRKLATGGMAEVFLAKVAGPMGFEKTLVLKRILPHMAEEPAFVEMFLNEARLAAQLNHPNIVQIFDFGEAEGAYYLAMEYIDGPNLRVLSNHARVRGLELPSALCARIISAACEGLAFAHDFRDPATGQPLALIHRDISPDNLLLSLQGAVKVVDFGIAKAANQVHKTQSGIIKGKFAYMPPEQLLCEPLDRRADVYALGVVLYELLTGHKPFDATSNEGIMRSVFFEPFVPAVERRPDLPVALQRILERALAKKREQRYPDCRTFQTELDRFVVSTTGESLGSFQISQVISQVMAETAALPPPPPIESPPATSACVTKPAGTLPFGAPLEKVGVTLSLKPPQHEPDAAAPPLPPHPNPQPLPPRPQKVATSSRHPPAPTQSRARVSMAALAAVMLLGGVGTMSWSLHTASANEDSHRKMESPPPIQPPVPPPPVIPGKATVEFRVLPFATVLLDGKELGVTPFEPIEIVEGLHTVRVINHELGKDVTRELKVEADRNSVFKLNLLKE